MIKFLLIDNDSTFLDKLEQIINAQCKSMLIEYTIDISLNGKNVDNYFFDFIFLDIDLDEDDDGISIAKKIKRNNKNSKIIFITSHEHLMHDTLRVQPFYFVRKKFLNKDIAIAFLLIKDYCSQKQVYIFHYNGRQRNINVDDVLYLETTDHVTTLHTVDHQEYFFYKTLQQVEDSINSKDIYRIQKKYCVNIKNIMIINGNMVEMMGGKKINIGRAYKKKFLDTYNKYICGIKDDYYV